MFDNSLFDASLMREAVRLAEEHWRYLHTIPEKAFEEKASTAYIRKACKGYPVDIIDIGMDTGLVCFLDAGSDKTVALRADIDAVPTEQGMKHLCGHDAHAATMLGAVHYLSAVRETLPCNVLFIFQPAEEGTHGARAMLVGNKAYRTHVAANKLMDEGKPAEAKRKYTQALEEYAEAERLGVTETNVLHGYAVLLMR